MMENIGVDGNRDDVKKILVLGESKVKLQEFAKIAEKYGISRERLECVLSYAACKRFNCSRLQYSKKYAVVLIGPMPHSTVSKGEYTSTVTALEQGCGFPPVIRMGLNMLKITKKGFERIIEKLIYEKVILQDLTVI